MLAGIFPGQGSQHPGMGKFLYDEFKIAKTTFEEASDALSLDFKKLCFDGSDSDLALTENTQPALVLVSVATFRVISSLVPLKLVGLSGHSVGEYSALVAAGSISFSEGLRSVRKRGQLMQSAVPLGEGGMSAVMGLDAAQTKTLCQWAQSKSGRGVVEPANFNCPGQIVISGNLKVLDWMKEQNLSEAFEQPPSRIKLIPLKVSAPFHCSLMKPAEDGMREVLSTVTFKKPSSPIVQNISAKPETDPAVIKENVIRQITGAVRWIECVETLKAQGAIRLIEFGCNKVLAGLVKKIDSESLQTFNVNSLEELKILEGALKA